MPKDLLTVETAVFQRDRYREMFGDVFDFLSSVKHDLCRGWPAKARVTDYLAECGDHAQMFDFAVDNNAEYSEVRGNDAQGFDSFPVSQSLKRPVVNNFNYEKRCIELASMSKVKADKLTHYSGRDPKQFLQFDVFTHVKEGDSVAVPDDDGESLFSGVTTELMTGLVSVRVLVVPDTPQETVVRALKKVGAWIERKPDLLDQDKRPDLPESPSGSNHF